VLGIAGALLIAGAAFYIVYTLQVAKETSEAEGRLGADWGSEAAAVRLPFYIKLTRMFLEGAYLDLASGFWSEKSLAAWKKNLVSAGMGRFISSEQFCASKFWMALFAALTSILVYVVAEEPPPPWFGPALTISAFFIPNIDVSSRRTARQLEIRLAMPYVIDLLTLSTEAGLDFLGSIGKVVDRAPPGPFIEELSIVLKDIQLGRTRSESLREMAVRCDMPELTSFVAIIVSSDAMGASIGNVLRAQSDTLRTERLVKAEKMGAAASQKILIPLVFFILPAVMLMIFGPIILGMLGIK
jgi:tight adherence protein C